MKTLNGNFKWEPGKKPPNSNDKRLKKITGGPMRTSQPCKEVDKSQKRIILLVKNLSTQLWETEKENRIRKSIDKKSPELNKKMWKENRKIIEYRYCQ